MEQRENLIYSIDPMNQIVEFNYMGSPSFEEWVSVMYAVLADRSFQPGYGLFERSPGYVGLAYNRVCQVGNRLSARALCGDWGQKVGNFGERDGELRDGPNGAAARARTSLSDRGFY